MLRRVVGTLALVSSLALSSALAGEITVTGRGVVWAEPDQATLEIGWSGVEAEVASAIAQADAVVAAIRTALEGVGIDPLDLRTVAYSMWREDRWDERGEPQPVGFRVYHTLQVLVRDVTAVGRAISAATDAGANQISSLGFFVADPAALESEARAAAVASARQRAAELAALTGLTLGSPLAVEEVGRAALPTWAHEYDAGGVGGGATVAAGRQAVEVVVQVTFAAGE